MELKGIQVESFAHPEDIAAYKVLEKTKINKIIEWLSSIKTRISLKTKLLAEYFLVSEESEPYLYGILNDVCKTLDYDVKPKLFTYRSSIFDYTIYIGDYPAIVLTDYVLNDFDENMLRFHLGCAVTALKAKTNQLKMAATFAAPMIQQIPILGETVLPVLADWCRKTTFTENRGGLLACQDIGTAMRVLIRTTGLPTELIDTTVVPELVQNYCNTGANLVKASQFFKTIYRIKPWKNDEICELMKWYSSGSYDDILDDYR